MGEDRILRQLGLRVPQQRCARHNAHGRSKNRVAGGCGWQSDPASEPAGAHAGCGTRRSNRNHSRLQSSLALWVLKQDSELLFTGDAGTTEPSRPSQRQGIEWINYYRPYSWLLLDAELAFTKARFTDPDPAGDHIPGAVESVVTLAATVDNLGNGIGTLQFVYFGSRPLIEDNSVRSSVYAVTNLRVGYKVHTQGADAARRFQFIRSLQQRYRVLLRIVYSWRRTRRRRTPFTSTRRSHASSG